VLGWVAFALARVLVRETDVPHGLVVNPVPLPPTPVSQASRTAVVDALLSLDAPTIVFERRRVETANAL